MDDEVEADARTSGMKGEGSECSGDSFKSSASDSQLVVVKADTNIKKLHNGDPEHLSSDEECVVEECSSGKVTVHSDEDSENVEKESLDSEEEDFKLHVDVDVSDQEGSDAESSGNRQLEPVRANSAGDSEVIELSAGEDDDCEVVEIKEKERTDKESERRQEEKTGRIENNSVEVVDIDDSAELDKVEMAGSARFVGGKPVEESGNPSPALEDDQNVEECLGAVVARGKDGVALEDDEDLGKCEETDRSSVCEETQLVYPLRLEEKEHILENTGEDDHGVDNYLNKNNINEREEERRQVKESGEEVGDLFRHCDPEVVVTRTLPSSASDECTGETSADLSDSDDFIGFESTEPHIFSKEFCHVEGSGPRDGEIVGTLHVSADTHFFTAEGGEGPSTASGSEAGDSSRLSPVPTESSRCNSPTASSASGDKRGGRKRVSLDLTNPLYMKPFQLGWKRELVYRSAMDSANRRMADVYYYTPTNKKIRSARELLEHVDGVELTTKNFLFTKEPLGLDSSMEKIRDARKSLSLREAAWPKDGKEGKEEGEAPSKPPEKHKPARAAEPTPVPAAAPVPVPEATTPEPALAPAPSAPKSPHSSSSAVALRKAATTPTLRSFPRIKVTPTRTQKEEGGAGKGAVAGKRAQPRPLLPKPRDDLQVGVLPPLWSVKSAPTPTPTPKKAAVSTTWSSAPKMVSEPLEKKMDPCSIHCPLKMGVIPTLQCRLCVCLYHPECVGLGSFSETIHSYVCKNCQTEIREGKTSLVAPPPLADQPKALTDAGKLVTVPRLVKTREVFAPGKKILGSVTTWLPASASVQVPEAVSVPASAPASMQSVAWMNGRKYIVVPKHNVLSVSPSPADKAPAAVQSTPASGASKDPSVLLGSPPGVLLVPLLPSADKGGPLHTQYLIVNAPPGGGLVLPTSTAAAATADSGKEQRGRKRAGSGSDEGPPAKQPCKQQCAHSLVHDVCVLYIVMERECRVRRGKEQHGRKRAGSGSDEGPPAKQPCKQQCAHSLVHDVCVLYIVMERECRVRRGKEQRGRKRAGSGSDEGPPAKQQCKQQCAHSLVHDVCVLYNVLQHVFQYLKVQELLRAARVCRLWRDLAQHPSLWASVHMKNSKVSDWQGLATTLSARGTAHLDLRKMLLPQRSEDVAAMWQQFRAVVGRMDGLQRLDLCRCPASVVQHVLTACPRLRTLNATAISCNSISLAAAGGLEHLEELRLKSLSGITLESSLGVLSQLSSLKHLALTTFRNLGQQGVEVIGQLESLELLELGEVNNLAATFPAESLACLGKLRRLRLEKVQGPDTLTFNYLETARSLAQLTQLELVNFDVKPGFDSILASCTNIRKLLIIPTYVTQSATTNRMVLGGVLQLASTLQVFVWGVTHELLRVTELFVDQCDVDQAKKEQLKKGDCIPVLKPVPGIAAVLSPSDAWSCEEKYGGPTPSVEILSLPKLHKLLNVQLPGTRVKLLKIPFHATWRQYLSDMHA
ncbi:uncharacterized protein LOC134540142 isoform X1 [Bacillus rossius redtenbacheri]|uniref:uncharacterized protein LOC134540142 isoform X1 n=1 Tax=Bacillus rossius redtenbacheri TaxID=93214 RepID=UPI002FDD1982